MSTQGSFLFYDTIIQIAWDSMTEYGSKSGNASGVDYYMTRKTSDQMTDDQEVLRNNSGPDDSMFTPVVSWRNFGKVWEIEPRYSSHNSTPMDLSVESTMAAESEKIKSAESFTDPLKQSVSRVFIL